MKRYFILIFTQVFLVSAFAQAVKIDDLMKLRPEGIGTLNVDSNTAIYLPMPFSESRFTDISQLQYVPGLNSIYGIDLVYTRFREVDSFNQPKLNFYRFSELKKIAPEIFNSDEIKWRVLEQREAKTKENAEKCFHGFVIYLKNDVPDSVSKREIKIIKDVLDSYSDTLIWVPEKIEWKVKKRKVETGNYVPRNDKKKKQGITYKSRGLWFREPEYEIFRDSTVKKKTGGYFKKIAEFDTSYFRGTSEFRTLIKRKWSPKTCVVADVTGSMTPYSTQVMLWIKYNPEILKHGKFAFFNDGDNIPDIYKKTGSTGGIYFSQSHEYDSVLSVMSKTMSNGLGGDLPENNLEAVRESLKRWPDTDSVLLIADNNAPVKDLSLLSGISKPVSVMACGVTDRIHPDYIKIVNATGGRLFVLEQELQNLKNLKNGTRIKIGTSTWEYQKGGLFKVK